MYKIIDFDGMKEKSNRIHNVLCTEIRRQNGSNEEEQKRKEHS